AANYTVCHPGRRTCGSGPGPNFPLEKPSLALLRWGHEPARIKPRPVLLVDPDPLAGFHETLLQQVRPQALPPHAAAEIGIVVAAAAHLVNARHHVSGLQGKALLEPRPEDVLHLPGQA